MGATVERRLTAFGVTKTIAEWEMDRRSAVYASLILRRLEEGMSPEQAIATPTVAVERGPTKYLAWGERKSLRDWADDPRCGTSYGNLKGRVEDDWPIEEAISTPTAARTRYALTAWGETKSLRGWERDERTVVSRGAIVRRLEEGWDAERALSEPPEGFVEIVAWGEAKNQFAWSNDARAVVSYHCIGRRLSEGWTPEEAISTPASVGPREVTAWGETKSAKAWSEDPRAAVSSGAILLRLDEGMAPEAAISTPSQRSPRLVEAWGEAKTIAEWAEDPRCLVARAALEHRIGHGWPGERAMTEPVREHGGLTAWGETKGLRAWARDPRGRAAHGIIGKRLEQGWTPEAAISTPPRESDRSPIEAFGESKGLTEWTRDPRCRVNVSGLRDRLLAGLPPEEAITRPPQPCNREGLEAFGEWRTFADWARDPRCSVEAASIQKRVAGGMPAEEAITRPGKLAPREEAWSQRPKGMPNFARCVEAWGEERSPKAWARDPRAAVGAETMLRRIAEGMAPELAIATPGQERVKWTTAFGETKTTAEWAADPRCAVSADGVRKRLKAGWDPEAAIATPDPRTGMTDALAAFGESKTLTEWARDARCVVNYRALAARMRKGADLEEALTRPALPQPGSKAGIEAFGERKRIFEWAVDPRCAVSAPALKGRLAQGWPAERAIAEPIALSATEARHSALGETKTLKEWAADPRCPVSYTGLRGRVLLHGMSMEEAMTRPLQRPSFAQAA